MTSWLIATLALSATVTDTQLSAGERWPLAVVVLNPRAGKARASVSDVRASMGGAIERHTDLYVSPLDPALDRCAGRLSCLVPAILVTGAGASEPPKLAVVLSVIAAEQVDRIAAVIIDLDRAAAALASTTATSTPDERDAVISNQAVVGRPSLRQLRSFSDLDAELDGLVVELAPVWRDHEATSALAGLVVDLPAQGLIWLDDRVLGEASSTVRVRELRPGLREIQLDVTGFEPVRLTVKLGRGTETQLNPEWQRAVRAPWARVRAPQAWTAAIATAAGSALLVYSAVDTAELRTSCLRRDDTQACPVGAPVRLFLSPASLDDRGVGPLTAGLGLALVVGGASMLGTELALNDREDAPWWISVATGVGVALLTYGVAEVVTAATTR